MRSRNDIDLNSVALWEDFLRRYYGFHDAILRRIVLVNRDELEADGSVASGPKDIGLELIPTSQEEKQKPVHLRLKDVCHGQVHLPLNTGYPIAIQRMQVVESVSFKPDAHRGAPFAVTISVQWYDAVQNAWTDQVIVDAHFASGEVQSSVDSLD